MAVRPDRVEMRSNGQKGRYIIYSSHGHEFRCSLWHIACWMESFRILLVKQERMGSWTQWPYILVTTSKTNIVACVTLDHPWP